MRLLLLTAFLFIAGCFLTFGQTTIDNFDSSVLDEVYTVNSEGPPTVFTTSDNTTDFQEGSGSIQMIITLGNIHTWGTFCELHYGAPEGTTFNWSISDTLRLWVKVYEAPTSPENMYFRIQFQDQPAPGDPLELWIYESAIALDTQTDWYELVIPFRALASDGSTAPSDSGFTVSPVGWGIAHNNEKFDVDKLVSYGLVAVTGIDITDSLKIGFDNFTRSGHRAVPYVVFNGRAVPSDLSLFVWGQSAVNIEDGAGATPNTNAVRWVQGDEWSNGWTGFGYNISPSWDMAGAWEVDSLKLKIKCPAGTGPLRAQFESANGKMGTVFQPMDDDQWHQYSLPLNEFVVQDGAADFDSSQVTVFGLMAEASAVAGRVIYIDDIWTGNPSIDVAPPNPPTELVASAGSYVNTILWTDTPNEAGESYRVYYSRDPIADPEAAGVEVVSWPLNTLENISTLDHVLRAPKTDQSVTYYYAAVCTDAAGNVSVLSDNSAPITNTAQGVTIINPTAPTNFAADGDLSDWAGITPFRIFPSDGSGHVVTNTTIDGDNDLSALAYVAVDENYLYVAFDVVDDIVSTDTTLSSYLIDSPDLFIGLYDWHGTSHTSLRDGDEPDYHFRFGRNAAIIDNIGAHRILEQGDANYYWDEKFTPGYVVEAKIAWSDLAAIREDALFNPYIGMRIPIDFSFNDADATGEREGILTYSQFSEDLSYQDVSRWLYTWIGDQWTDVENNQGTVLNYKLSQNYPNPFNPTTQINYTVEEPGLVTLKVYDMLGKEVMTLVNVNQGAGQYVAQFNGAGLASGMYIYKLQVNDFVSVKKMILMK